MTMKNEDLIRTLHQSRKLSENEWTQLFTDYDEEDVTLAMTLARKIALARVTSSSS